MQDCGSIVVDSCTLVYLQATVQPVFVDDRIVRGRPPRHYLDLLSFLARQGWRVLLPEMVAVESAGVLLGAPNINDLFSASGYQREIQLNNLALRRWVKQARDGRLPGVAIIPAAPATPVGDYLDSLRRVAADPFYTTRRKCVLLALVQKKDRPHFGETACLDEIEHCLRASRNQEQPVFFLSDDAGAQKLAYLQFGPQIGRLNFKGFLTALARLRLIESLCLRRGCGPKMCADILQQAPHGGGEWPEDRPCVDSNRSPHEENNFPFRTAMALLSKKLDPRTDFVESRRTCEPPRPSRTEQFRRKWNWRRFE